MNMRKAWRLTTALLLVLLIGCVQATELRTAAQPNTPKFFRINGQQTGICYDIIQAISRIDPSLRFVGFEQEIPTKRIESMLEQGSLDVYFGFLQTPERLSHFDFINVPLFTPQPRLLTRKDDTQLTIYSLEDLAKQGKDGVVLTARGTPHVEKLKQLQPDLIVDAGTDDNVVNLKKLLRGRGRAFYQFDFMLAHALQQSGLQDAVRWQPYRGNTELQYLAVSRSVPADTRTKLQHALEQLQGSGELQKIYSKYVKQR